MPELSRREQNKVDTRTRIIAAAAEKFLTQGVDQSTVSEVARLAGVSRGTFFNYFPTKDSVLAAMWEDMADLFAQVTSREMAEDATTRQRVLNVFHNFANAAEREPDYMRLVSGEMNRPAPSGETPTARADVVTDHLVKIMEAGQAAGDVRTDHSAQFLARMVTAGYVAAIMRWRANPEIDIRGDFAKTAEFVTESIMPPTVTDRDSIA